MEIPADYCGGVFSNQKKEWSWRRRCCVPGCLSKYNPNISFHRFPKDKKLNKFWKIKCRIIDKISPNLLVCGIHFVDGDFVKGKQRNNARKQYLLSSAVPTQKLPIASFPRPVNASQNQSREERLLRRTALEAVNEYVDDVPQCHSDVNYLTVEQQESEDSMVIPIELALELNIPIPKQFDEKGIQVNTSDGIKFHMNVMDLLTNENHLNSWTGLPTFALLHKIEECVCVGFPETMDGHGLSVSERILLCFIKLKTNLTFACMTSIFCVTNATISRNFNVMIPILTEVLDPVVYFPSTDEIKDNLPIAFRKYNYHAVRAVIDCTEVKVQLPKCMNCRISTYSRYKSGHTFKFMVSITPGGLISHVSKAYTGKASDKFIFNSENLIEKFDAYHDSIMMDKGTMIEDELLERGLQMVRPSFFRSEMEQFEEAEQICNTKIAKLRVHVERAIQRMKIFEILTDCMEYNIQPQVDNIVFICAAIANLTKPILAANKF